MAKKYDRNKYQNLKNQKASNEHQQEVCQLEINEIDAKIDRLRDAYNTLDDAKEAIDDINKNQKNMISSDLYQSLWTGSRAQYFYDGYVSNIDDAEDAINWEINALNERKNEKYGILSGLVNAWDDLCTRIRNFFN